MSRILNAFANAAAARSIVLSVLAEGRVILPANPDDLRTENMFVPDLPRSRKPSDLFRKNFANVDLHPTDVSAPIGK